MIRNNLYPISIPKIYYIINLGCESIPFFLRASNDISWRIAVTGKQENLGDGRSSNTMQPPLYYTH